ncbi:hypothetical protein ACLEPN_22045, partial [Myxococcus sp. 1LA]
GAAVVELREDLVVELRAGADQVQQGRTADIARTADLEDLARVALHAGAAVVELREDLVVELRAGGAAEPWAEGSTQRGATARLLLLPSL